MPGRRHKSYHKEEAKHLAALQWLAVSLNPEYNQQYSQLLQYEECFKEYSGEAYDHFRFVPGVKRGLDEPEEAYRARLSKGISSSLRTDPRRKVEADDIVLLNHREQLKFRFGLLGGTLPRPLTPQSIRESTLLDILEALHRLNRAETSSADKKKPTSEAEYLKNQREALATLLPPDQQLPSLVWVNLSQSLRENPDIQRWDSQRIAPLLLAQTRVNPRTLHHSLPEWTDDHIITSHDSPIFIGGYGDTGRASSYRRIGRYGGRSSSSYEYVSLFSRGEATLQVVQLTEDNSDHFQTDSDSVGAYYEPLPNQTKNAHRFRQYRLPLAPHEVRAISHAVVNIYKRCMSPKKEERFVVVRWRTRHWMQEYFGLTSQPKNLDELKEAAIEYLERFSNITSSAFESRDGDKHLIHHLKYYALRLTSQIPFGDVFYEPGDAYYLVEDLCFRQVGDTYTFRGNQLSLSLEDLVVYLVAQHPELPESDSDIFRCWSRLHPNAQVPDSGRKKIEAARRRALEIVQTRDRWSLLDGLETIPPFP